MVAAEIKWDTLSGRLIESRTRRGLTRRQASSRAGLSQEATLRRYEKGVIAAPREDIVFSFARAFGCNPLWLMYGRGDPDWDPAWKR